MQTSFTFAAGTSFVVVEIRMCSNVVDISQGRMFSEEEVNFDAKAQVVRPPPQPGHRCVCVWSNSGSAIALLFQHIQQQPQSGITSAMVRLHLSSKC
jgi:hypothetical protein